jgi:translation initiation factor 5A
MIKGHPCKVTDVSTSKTGKHGHAKCHFVAIDIFTGKKMEDLVPSTHNTEVPVVSRKEYTLLDINEDGEVSLMDDAGTQKSDINLPEWNPDPKYVEMLVAAFEDGQTITVTVQRALGMEMIVSHKIDQEG